VYNMPQKLVAEFVGTFALIFFGAGSDLRRSGPPHGWTGRTRILGIALAHAWRSGSWWTSLGHISGGHFNPAVTIGFWVTRKLATMDTLAFWAAQLAGASAAAYLLRPPPVDVWTAVRLGTPDLGQRRLAHERHDLRRHHDIFSRLRVSLLQPLILAGAFNKIAGFCHRLDDHDGSAVRWSRSPGRRSILRALSVQRSPRITGPTTGFTWIGPLGGRRGGWVVVRHLLPQEEKSSVPLPKHMPDSFSVFVWAGTTRSPHRWDEGRAHNNESHAYSAFSR